jgi:hypothetical protein
MSRVWTLLGCALLLFVVPAAAERGFERTEERTDCAHYDGERRPWFGDVHVHTTYSFDAWGQGTRNDPFDAYRFAKGEPLGVQPYNAAGAPQRSVRLRRPLDFAMVSDHAEKLGETHICRTPGAPGYDHFTCVVARRWPKLGYTLINSLFMAVPPGYLSFCGEDGAVCKAAAQEPWRKTQEAAEQHYDRSAACRFTSFVGVEWSGMPNGNNLHRNLVFRNNIVPATIPNYVEDQTPERLRDRLDRDCIEAATGCDVLAIPHNSNVSGGMMFAAERMDGEALDEDWARQRSRLEPLVEITQHKGDSECALGNAGDELCGFETLPYALMAQMAPQVPGESPPAGSYVREALGSGLLLKKTLGANPFAFGIIGSTDGHLGAPGLVAEDGFVGQAAGTVSARLAVPPLPDRIDFNPGGLAVLWAEENSRDALFGAMRRREAYGTSGPRMQVRFFGSWDEAQDSCGTDAFVAEGYARGVPMGGELASRPEAAAAPTFSVWALKDPGVEARPGTRLERIQIIKSWAVGGATETRVFDVAGENEPGEVDLASCVPAPGGADDLCTEWRDPEFDPAHPAVYYARVVERPSCRWNQWACNAAGVDCADPRSIAPGQEACCDPGVPRTIRERAWTSPIWYTP